jgi:predicted dehydrogenase
LAESPASTKETKPARDLRLGLVGAGAIAQLAHLPVLSKIKGAQLVALCDNDGPKASDIAERL